MQKQEYRVYQDFNGRGWLVVKAIVRGVDYGIIGDLQAKVPESRDLARFIAKSLNEKGKKVYRSSKS